MKVAVIGTWHVHTKEYAEAIQTNPNTQLTCCWDPDKARGEAFAKEKGIPFVGDINEIWSDSEIEAVQVTTATTMHKEVLIAAAKAKKHIFTEKVLAVTNEEAAEIAQAVKESGVVFCISFPHRTFPTLRKAKELLESGKLGEITYARVHNYHDGSIAGWLPDTFYNVAETGGGAMMDLGAHPMYTLSWFLGKPKSIVSMFTKVTGKAVEDNAVSVIEFADGAIGVSETGFVTVGNPYLLELSGTEGSLLVCQGKLSYASKTDTEGKWVEDVELPEKMPLPLDLWVDAIVNGKESPFGMDDALALTELMVGAYQSDANKEKYYF